jgi:hypothetical protein
VGVELDGRAPLLLDRIKRAVVRVAPKTAGALALAAKVEIRRFGGEPSAPFVEIRATLADPAGFVFQVWMPRCELLEAWHVEKQLEKEAPCKPL